MIGTIVFLNRKYGFVKGEDGQEYFFSSKCLRHPLNLKPPRDNVGKKVLFKSVVNNGRSEAVYLRDPMREAELSDDARSYRQFGHRTASADHAKIIRV